MKFALRHNDGGAPEVGTVKEFDFTDLTSPNGRLGAPHGSGAWRGRGRAGRRTKPHSHPGTWAA